MSTAIQLTRPFEESDLYGLSDDELRQILTLDDLVDPAASYSPERLSGILDLTEDEIFAAFREKSVSGGRYGGYVVADVRDRFGSPEILGTAVQGWLSTHPDIAPCPDAIALRVYRSKHPEFFQEPRDQLNLVEQMRLDADQIKQDTEAAAKAAEAERFAARFDRVAQIIARFEAPQDGDSAEMLRLMAELNLTEGDIHRLARVSQTAYRIQRRFERGMVDDQVAGDTRSLLKLAATAPGLFDMSGDLPRLKYPPVVPAD